MIPGQFVIHLRSFQGGFAHSNVEGITSPAYTVLEFIEKEKHYDLFWKYIFNSESFVKRLETVTYGIRDGRSISYDDFSEITFQYPNLGEQKRIGDVFITLDRLISLQQREHDKTVNIKKALFEKMFPKAGEDKPEIRFAGFTDDWEQRKLSDYLETSNEKNIDNIYFKQDVLSVSGDVGIVNQIEFQGRSFAGASVSNYWIVNIGDVVYTKSPLRSNPFGIIKTNTGKPGIVSTLYAVYHPKINVYPGFIQTYFEQNARVNKYLQPLVNKGAKNDMKVSADNALKGLVCFPNYDEQKRISEFFTHFDRTLTLHQRELNKLKNIKKALLEKMFV